jgi:hypothetical protein
MAEKNLLTGHTKGEKKKRKASTYFFMCFVMTRKKKKRRLCVCVCVWNERIFAGVAAECASARRETDVM